MWQIARVIPALVFLLGLVIGSFLNVCIRRLPAGESVVRPASHCPACKAPIRPYDNIPLLSYLALRGKCRDCGTRISPVYPVVELLTGLLFLSCYAAFGLTFEGLKWTVFSSLMIVLILTDLRERILPDAINFPGLGFALVISLAVGVDDGSAEWLSHKLFAYPPPDPVLSFVDAVFGAAAAGGLLWVVSEAFFRLRGQEGMGLGDVKMMAMVGAFLGLKLALLTILIGSLGGSILGLTFIALRRKGTDYELPFGTFLGVAALLAVFFGRPLLEWYVSVSGWR